MPPGIHRQEAVLLLPGRYGLEIGAMHNPFAVPPEYQVEYLDVEGSQALHRLFPELHDAPMVPLDYIGDIGKDSVAAITGKVYDFVILSHVLEHVANPIQVIQNVWAGIREGGDFVLAVPDKDFTFDHNRPLTPYEHLLADYFCGEKTVSDDHYTDFLTHVHPEVFRSKEVFIQALGNVRKRREHVHVWNSESFRASLVKIFALIGAKAQFVYESQGKENQLEYFALIKKKGEDDDVGDALQTLLSIYQDRPDLQRAFPAVQGDHIGHLLQWVISSGLTSDGAKIVLSRYEVAYRELASNYQTDHRLRAKWDSILAEQPQVSKR